MHPTYPITVDLPQDLYSQIVLLAGARGKSINQIIIEALESSIQVTRCDYDYGDEPLGPQWGTQERPS